MREFSEKYQIALIALFFIVALFLFFFIYQELNPEYHRVQLCYEELEKFRTTYTLEKEPNFKEEIKQIVINPECINGPEIVDRCTTCHLAVKLPHFSPTRIAFNIDGEVEFDNLGYPILEPNPTYIFTKLDKEIAALKAKGDNAKALELEGLKELTLDGKKIDVSKVLQMHPLIGREEVPFDFHPIEEYGCVVCHLGNGHSITSKRAHGPIFDDTYEIAKDSIIPSFVEKDEVNDLLIAKAYNAKPRRDLLFQTSPLMVGPLLQAQCLSCHASTQAAMNQIVDDSNALVKKKENQIQTISDAIQSNKEALASILSLVYSLKKVGCTRTIELIKAFTTDPQYTAEEIDHFEAQLKYVQAFHEQLLEKNIDDKDQPKYIIHRLKIEMQDILGSEDLTRELLKEAKGESDYDAIVNKFLEKQKGVGSKKSIFSKMQSKKELSSAAEEMKLPIETLTFLASQNDTVKEMSFGIDSSIQNYIRGQNLYITQGCYGCHRIAGYSRGTTGPDLSSIGLNYPWYVKLSIVWPQGKLASSTMPTFKLDHEEVQDLMTFLMAQKGTNKRPSQLSQKVSIKDWESGEKLPWEEPIKPNQMHDMTFAMTLYATEGCASCHQLQGFVGNVGFALEKEPSEGEEYERRLLKERAWFTHLFPEQISTQQLVETLQEYKDEIIKRLEPQLRSATILALLEEKYPTLLESFYSNFKYALRLQNHNTDVKVKEEWKELVHQVFIMYIQEYGLGRDIAPHLNWSGVYRDTAWLMGHFKNPGEFSPRSFMPAMPFDDSKFYNLTLMLQTLGQKNRDAARGQWEILGFNPIQAYELYCAQCHGDGRRGNGPVSQMLYPVPKNLRNTTFLLNLTKEQALDSIAHGVKGTPMPPWGEVPEGINGLPVLSANEIEQLVNWLYQSLPDEELVYTSLIVPKWHYTPQDVVDCLKNERGLLTILPDSDIPKYEVGDYFDIKPNLNPGPEKWLYYIKKRFYTQSNIEAGQQLFIDNCAQCHGNEATGTGPRATTMIEAKPRMLTNLAWLQTKDDLRLLRSIKFGIPGTSMTPWGDQTTVQQRLELAIFIRSLSEEKALRERLTELLYKNFTTSILLIEEVRATEYGRVEIAKEKYDTAFSKVQMTQDDPEVAGQEYTLELQFKKDYQKLKEIDQILIDLEVEIKKEQAAFDSLGTNLINKKVDEALIDAYFDAIDAYGSAFVMENDKLVCHSNDEAKDKREALFAKIDQNNLSDIKTRVMTTFALANRSRKEQCDLYNKFTLEENP